MSALMKGKEMVRERERQRDKETDKETDIERESDGKKCKSFETNETKREQVDNENGRKEKNLLKRK
jgi:hypothetical protein